MKQKLVSEFLGTAFLLAIVVGSGIMGESLAGGNLALALLVNSLATGAGLFVLIKTLGSLSGAHFNPIVSFVEMLWNRLSRKEMILYWGAQFAGGIIGVWMTHLMFNQNIFQIALKPRIGLHFFISEIIASFGLICTIALCGRKHVEYAPQSIAAYIVAAYWFTSSSSFANPALTFARIFTDTFCGISPAGVAPFILAQFIGALAAYKLLKCLAE
jgi:glycerol uptake facilitator-like aquaporin